VRCRAGASRAELHLGLVRFGVSDEILEIIDWQVFARFQHEGNFGDEDDRREIGRRIVERVLVKRLTLGMGAHCA
jgi:hypothetical protein